MMLLLICVGVLVLASVILWWVNTRKPRKKRVLGGHGHEKLTEETKSSSKEKEEAPKDSKRDKKSRGLLWAVLMIIGIAITVTGIILVIWLWQNQGPKEPSTPECSTYYDLTGDQLNGDEAARKVTVCDDWLPLATVMPTWYSQKGDYERKFFDTDQYVLLMRINKGEPFKFSTGNGMNQGKQSYSIDEYLAAEVMMDPDGLHPIGFVTFRLKR